MQSQLNDAIYAVVSLLEQILAGSNAPEDASSSEASRSKRSACNATLAATASAALQKRHAQNQGWDWITWHIGWVADIMGKSISDENVVP